MNRIANTRDNEITKLRDYEIAIKVRAALLRWYDEGRRDLPWRRSLDPYHVWVSEIMLQQTRVETVLPYYDRWIARYPTIDALAAADEQDVLKQWEGLGYYSRARNLHQAAQLVRERYHSKTPESYEALCALPGIGEYTAGAIASIAYNQPVSAIDGNVRRVLSRLFDVAAPKAASVRPLAEQLLDPGRPGDFNQALMELGARVCLPRNPSCPRCPVRLNCLAREHGTVLERPGASTQRRLPHEHVSTLVTLMRGRVIVSQRPSKGLLANLWQFPEVTRLPKHARELGEITHTFSHKRITYHVYISKRARTPKRNERWVRLGQLDDFALPKAQRRIEQLVLAQSSNVGLAPPGGVRRGARP